MKDAKRLLVSVEVSLTSREAHPIMPNGPRRTTDYPQDSTCVAIISELRLGMISGSA